MPVQSYVFLFTQGIVVDRGQLIHEQAVFFQELFPRWGTILFLLAATAFLADTWLATVDAVSRGAPTRDRPVGPARETEPVRDLRVVAGVSGVGGGLRGDVDEWNDGMLGSWGVGAMGDWTRLGPTSRGNRS